MSADKNFRDRRNESRDDIVAFWGTVPGLITAGVIGAAIVGGIIWQLILGLAS